MIIKPNTRSPLFVLSLLFIALFAVQSFVEGQLVEHAVKDNKPTGSVALVYWLGLLWLSVAATLFYKTTRFKQTATRQLLVFILAPFVFAPLAAIIYVALVLLPTYSLVNSSGFSH